MSRYRHWSLQASVPSGDTSVSAISCANGHRLRRRRQRDQRRRHPVGQLPERLPPGRRSCPPPTRASLYVNGVACTRPPVPPTCAAVGASPTGAFIATGRAHRAGRRTPPIPVSPLTGLPTTPDPCGAQQRRHHQRQRHQRLVEPRPRLADAGGTATPARSPHLPLRQRHPVSRRQLPGRGHQPPATVGPTSTSTQPGARPTRQHRRHDGTAGGAGACGDQRPGGR